LKSLRRDQARQIAAAYRTNGLMKITYGDVDSYLLKFRVENGSLEDRDNVSSRCQK
jgi:hypothetical protein